MHLYSSISIVTFSFVFIRCLLALHHHDVLCWNFLSFVKKFKTLSISTRVFIAVNMQRDVSCAVSQTEVTFSRLFPWFSVFGTVYYQWRTFPMHSIIYILSPLAPLGGGGAYGVELENSGCSKRSWTFYIDFGTTNPQPPQKNGTFAYSSVCFCCYIMGLFFVVEFNVHKNK